MIPGPRRLPIGTDPCSQPVDPTNVSHDVLGKSDEPIHDHHGISDAYSEVLTVGSTGTKSATLAAVPDIAYAPGLHVEAIRFGASERDWRVDPVEVNDREGQIVPRGRKSEALGVSESIACAVAAPEEAAMPHASPTIGSDRERTERALPDVPLIAEDLLQQARQQADSGAPTEAVKAIFDHVAALREGRA